LSQDETRSSGQFRPAASTTGAGDGASVELLHARYRERLRKYFLKHLGGAPDAEDLIQETFLRLAKPDRLAGIENVEAYVFRVAQNLILERRRQRSVRRADAHVELAPEAIDDQVFSPERILESREDLQHAVRALQELPARTRAIFVLQRFEGMTYVEIARKLGVTPSAIDKQMGRAIAHLAKRFAELK
jgi:RNA polymerase sigma factor (sigma-70 family)